MDRIRSSRGVPTLLAALLFLQGMEMVRFQFASLGWYQRDTLATPTLDLIPLALAPFLVGALLPIFSRFLTLRASLWSGSLVLVAARIVNQLVVDAAVDHWASAVGVAAFVGILAVVAGLGRGALVGGVLLGITIDTAIKGLGSSLDLAYQGGIGALAATVAISAVILYLVATVETTHRVGPSWGRAVTLLGIGPYLFIQYLVLQSSGWTAQVSQSGAPFTALRIVALDIIALWLAIRLGRSQSGMAICALIVGGTMVAAAGDAFTFSVLALFAVPAAGPLWAAMVPDHDDVSIGPAATFLISGMVLLLILGLANYLPLDLHLGFTQDHVRYAGAALVVLFGLIGAIRRAPSQDGVRAGIPALAALALVLPAVGLLGGRTLPAAPTSGPTRILDYNLHQAFATSGEMDPQAIAQEILDSGATVVGLQEVARGGLLNAGTDLLALLGDRLGWEHVAFIGTTDPVWGNAILSRYPLGEVERRLLPLEGTLYRRGYLAAPVDAPAGSFLFITTHLQQINDPDVAETDPEGDLYPVHHAQLGVVLDQWARRKPAVLVGDMNARPDWRQIQEVLDAGWVDSWAEAGSGPGYTSNAADPRYRIDYIFHTPDLEATGVQVIQSQASDHFAVVADLAPAGG